MVCKTIRRRLLACARHQTKGHYIILTYHHSRDFSHHVQISGGDGISVMTPMWSPSNVLHYISDESNWWNLYVSKENESPVPVIGNKNEEIGLPHWQFGNQGYAFNPENPSKIALTYNGVRPT